MIDLIVSLLESIMKDHREGDNLSRRTISLAQMIISRLHKPEPPTRRRYEGEPPTEEED
jgi:hypothetical protein